MLSYTGPKYHHDIDASVSYPAYDCKKSINENLAYFHHCDEHLIFFLNYSYDEYKDLLPNYSKEIVDSMVCSVGLSEQHVESKFDDMIATVNNVGHIDFTNDIHSFYLPF